MTFCFSVNATGVTGSSEMSNSSGVDEHNAENIVRSGHKHFLPFSHCQAECKQISMWQKGLVGQGWAGLTLKFNFHCLIQ